MKSTTKKSEPSRRGAPAKIALHTIALDDLTLDERCQARVKLNEETVDEYADLYRQKKPPLPPIEVFDVDGKHVVVDGCHRLAAAMKAERGFLCCKIVGTGTIEDAAWCALSKNHSHGLRRTNEDKRKAVRMALEGVGADQSSRVIAKHVGVDHKTVSRIRNEWKAERRQVGKFPNSTDEPEKVIGADGKKYTRKRKPKAAPATPTVIDVDGEEVEPTGNSVLPVTPDDDDPPEERAEADDRYSKIAGVIKGARRQIKNAFGLEQNVDAALEAAWRVADDLVPIDCPLCDGGGCKACSKGRTTKGAARRAKEKARSQGIARKAKP